MRKQSAQILAGVAVAAGASFVVTRNGAPVAGLRPLARGRRPFVPRAEVAMLAAAGSRLATAGQGNANSTRSPHRRLLAEGVVVGR